MLPNLRLAMFELIEINIVARSFAAGLFVAYGIKWM